MLASVPHEFFFAPTGDPAAGNGTIPTGVRYTIETIGGVEVYKPDAWRTDRRRGDRRAARGTVRERRRPAAPPGGAPRLSDREARRRRSPRAQSSRTCAGCSDPNSPTTVPKDGAINKVKGGKTPIPIVDATPRRRPIVSPTCWRSSCRAAFADAPSDPYRSQHEFLRSPRRRRCCAGSRAAERMERQAKEANRKFGVFIRVGQQRLARVARAQRVQARALWGGPQEGYGNPNIDVEMYVNSKAMRAGGMMIAGVPGVLIGQTNRFAFTTTSGEIDNSTLYVETLAERRPRPSRRRRTLSTSSSSTAPTSRWIGGPRRSTMPVRTRRSPRRTRPAGRATNDGPLLYNDLPRERLRPRPLPRLRDGVRPGGDAAARVHVQDRLLEERVGDRRGIPRVSGSTRTSTSSRSRCTGSSRSTTSSSPIRRGTSPTGAPARARRFPTASTIASRPTAPDARSGAPSGSDRYLPFSKSILLRQPDAGLAHELEHEARRQAVRLRGQQPRRALGRGLPLAAHGVPAREQRRDCRSKDVEEIERDVGTMDGSTDTIRAAAPDAHPLHRDGVREPPGRERSARRSRRASDARAGRADPRRLERVPGRYLADFRERALQPGRTIRRAASPACRSSSSGGTPSSRTSGAAAARRARVRRHRRLHRHVDRRQRLPRRDHLQHAAAHPARRRLRRAASTTRATTSAGTGTRSSSRA